MANDISGKSSNTWTRQCVLCLKIESGVVSNQMCSNVWLCPSCRSKIISALAAHRIYI